MWRRVKVPGAVAAYVAATTLRDPAGENPDLAGEWHIVSYGSARWDVTLHAAGVHKMGAYATLGKAKAHADTFSTATPRRNGGRRTTRRNGEINDRRSSKKRLAKPFGGGSSRRNPVLKRMKRYGDYPYTVGGPDVFHPATGARIPGYRGPVASTRLSGQDGSRALFHAGYEDGQRSWSVASHDEDAFGRWRKRAHKTKVPRARNPAAGWWGHDKPPKKKRAMRSFKVEVMRVNPQYLVAMGEPAYWRETITIKGYTLADAKERAGIQ